MQIARSLPRVALAFALALVVAGAPLGEAVAQQQDVVKQAERLNKKAMEDYDALEIDSARATLQSAITKLREAGEDETPTAAKVYVSLGVVYIAGFKDRGRGVQAFVSALKIDGTVELDPERATPELQEAFDEARRQVPRSGASPKKPPRAAPTPPPEEPATPTATGVTGLQHESVDDAPANTEVPIKAKLGRDVSATKMYLFYRGTGEDYTTVLMTLGRSGEWSAEIPADAMVGRSVQYYIEARDGKNRPIIAAGSAASPYIISIKYPERPSSSDDERPPGVAPPSRNRRDDPLAEEKRRRAAEERGKGRGYGMMFVNLLAGTGVGLQVEGNKFDVAYQYQNRDAEHPVGYFRQLAIGSAGLAISPLHGLLEIGVNVTRRVSLSGVLRLQGTLINNADSTDASQENKDLFGYTTKVPMEPSGMLRVRYLFKEGRLRPTLFLGLGGGFIRHVLDVTEAGRHGDDPPLTDVATALWYEEGGGKGQDPKALRKQNFVCPTYPERCWDTIGIGFIQSSVGFQLAYDFTTWKNGGFGFVGDVNLIFAFAQQFGINVDISVGLGAHFL